VTLTTMLKYTIIRMLSLLASRCGRRAILSIRRTSTVLEKKESDMLETINMDDLPRAQKRFAKQFEKVNEERIKEMFARNYKNHIAFTSLVLLTISIYFYTMYAVKQETFLEEIDQEMAAESPNTHGHLA
ncbi:hypothetical protein PFISCL1PPCAC_19818, partial [Pristionchus fissidentatus]